MKIAIVCGAPASEFLAPFDDKDWAIWVLGNRLDKFLQAKKRVTCIFEIHNDLSNQAPPYPAWLVSKAEEIGAALITGTKFPGATEAGSGFPKIFPFKSAETLFGSTYLTSSSAYMMALALLEGATEIGVFGVDMAVDDHEYFWQRPCMEAWIGFAKGRGVKVTIPENSPVGKSDYIEGESMLGKPDFSKAPFTQDQFSKMSGHHSRMIEKKRDEIDAITAQIAGHEGARQVYERLERVARAVEAGNALQNLTDHFEDKKGR